MKKTSLEKLQELNFIFRSFEKVSIFIFVVFSITTVFFFPKQADAALVCNSGTVNDTCTVSGSNTMTDGSTISGTGSIVVASGGTITAAAGARFTITMTGDVTVQSGGTISGNATINAANVNVNSGGTINVNGKGNGGGYRASGSGTGGGTGGDGTNGAGGGYGGAGGRSYNFLTGGGATYGSITAPTDLGSGGGSQPDVTTTGMGGGAVKIVASGTVTVDGSVKANGLAGAGGGSNYGGGGSGGSVWIQAGTLAGAGTISADGGLASNSPQGGNGGGGRIALYPSASDTFTGSITTSAGAISSSPTVFTGIIGTIVRTAAATPADITLASNTSWIGFIKDSSGNPGTFTFKSLTINSSVTLTANVSVTTVNNFTLSSSAVMSANGLGYPAGYQSNGSGPGAGAGSASTYGSGAGYGGVGGGSPSSDTPGTTYGSASAPVDLGSGGGSQAGCTGNAGQGGGAIKIVAGGTATITGSITANGLVGCNGGSAQGPGGSGGSIWIQAGTLAGAGPISAKGGNGANTSAGGGGGGRIAFSYTTKTYNGTVSVAKGTGYTTVPAADGTIFDLHSVITAPANAATLTTLTSITGTAAILSGSISKVQVSIKDVTDGSHWYTGSNFSDTSETWHDASGTTSWSYAAPAWTHNHTYLIRSKAIDSGSNEETPGTGNSFLFWNGTVVSTSAALSGTYANLLVNGGSSPTIAGNTTVTVTGDLWVTANSNIVVNSTNTTQNSGGVGGIINATNVTIDSGSSINANGTGYAGGEWLNGKGPGGGGGGGSVYGAGGGYGGAGGNNTGVTGGSPYGSITAPIDLGSGGGGVYTTPQDDGGAGGGAIKIVASGIVTVNGSVAANGGNVGWGGDRSGGGGSGGSVWIVAGSLAGSGSVTANGGTQLTPYRFGGAGGGGRIVLDPATSDTFTGSITASTQVSSVGVAGGLGTIVRDTAATPADITLASNASWVGMIKDTSGNPGTFTFNSLTINSGVTLTANVNITTVANFTVNSTAVISANGLGYGGGRLSSGYGPGGGGGGTGDSNHGAGGGYGGAGGTTNGVAGGGTYGSLTQPTDLGSGGGGVYDNTVDGAEGGGAIKIVAGGTLTVNGTIRANGSNVTGPNDRSGGGGSGGSIWLQAGTFAGTGGTITANGGGNPSYTMGGGGGGGRVAFYYTTYSYSGTITASGGTSAGSNAGAAGTIYGLAPSSTVTAPANNDSKNSTFTTITGTSVSPTGTISGVQVSIKDVTDGGHWYNGSNFTTATTEQWLNAGGTTSWTYAMPSSANMTNAHVYLIRSKAADNTGYSPETPATGNSFTYDNANPTVALTYSIAHAVKSGDTQRITATFNKIIVDSPIPQIAIAYTGGGSVAATNMTKTDTTHYYYDVTIPSGSDGTATVTISNAQDVFGNPNSVATSNTFIVDNTLPISAITAICTTAGNGCTTPGQSANPQEAYKVLSISGTASDTGGSGVGAIEISIKDTTANKWYGGSGATFTGDSETYLSATGTNAWSFNTAALSLTIDHIYLIHSKSTDAALNIESPVQALSFKFVNSPPVVSNVTAVEASSGVLTVGYDVTDLESTQTTNYLFYSVGATLNGTITSGAASLTVSDATLFPTSGTILIDDEMISYASKSGNVLQTLTRGALSTTAAAHNNASVVYLNATSATGTGIGLSNKGTGKVITWTAKTDTNGYESAAAVIKVVANDGSAGSMIGSLASSAFMMDAKNPTGTLVLGIDAGTATLTGTDVSSITYKLQNGSSVTSGTAATVGSNVWVFGSETNKTVSALLSDSYGNQTSITTVAPATPTSFQVKDITNLPAGVYGEALSWTKVTDVAGATALSCEVWRATDTGASTLLSTIAATSNIYSDVTVLNNHNYLYKVRALDSDGDYSAFSAVQSSTPSGTAITSVAHGTPTAAGVTITWTTDLLSNSVVDYGTAITYGSSTTGTDGNTKSHTVTLAGLTPATPYYFRVKSMDGNGNTSTNDNAGAGYTFTTAGAFNITATTDANGTITPGGVTAVQSGANQTYTITPNAGYQVATLTVDGSTISPATSYTFTNVIAPHTVNVTFAINAYNITATTDANGTITPGGVTTVQSGANQTYTITPNTGYQIATLTVDGISLAPISSYTFTNVTATHTIDVTFTNAPDVTAPVITLAGDNPAHVVLNSLFVDPGATATDDKDGNITNSIVKTGTVNTSAVGEYAITYNVSDAAKNKATATRTVIVKYADTYDITASATGKGTISPAGVTSVPSTTDKAYTFTPDDKYKISSLVVDGVDLAVDTTYTFTNVIAPHTISVTFAPMDSLPPIITVLDVNPMNIDSGTEFKDPGATAVDAVAGDPVDVVATGTVNTNVGGIYTITYTATDANNNVATAERTVNVADITPPVITLPAEPSIVEPTQAVITWTTDEDATGQVVYGKTSCVDPSACLQSEKIIIPAKWHLVVLSDLDEKTAYYYSVVSTDKDKNTATSLEQTFTTIAKQTITVGGGGGASGVAQDVYDALLAQNKIYAAKFGTDTSLPTVSDVQVSDITPFGATISFATSKDTIAYINYGKDTSYGMLAADDSMSQNHTIKISGLTLGTEYNFKVKVLDALSNVGYSDNQTFTTEYLAENMADLQKIDNVEQFQAEIESTIQSILPSLVPPFIDTPTVTDITENSATINFRTNVKSYPIVDYVTDSNYDASKDDPYDGEVSDVTKKTIDHTIILNNLKSNTKYHVMTKAFSLPQVVGKSADFTFTTAASKIQASVIGVQKDSFTVVWTTDEPTSSIVEYKDLKTGIINRVVDSANNTSHSVNITGLTPGTNYEVSVSGVDAKGNTIESGSPENVSTSIDVTPPIISNLKVDSSLIVGLVGKVQTIISWQTDEPSTSVVNYAEGSGSIDAPLTSKQENLELTVNHVIILTSLKAGTVYRFALESTDGAGNTAKPPIRTIVTPQQTASIMDIIFKNFDDTFKFINNVK